MRDRLRSMVIVGVVGLAACSGSVEQPISTGIDPALSIVDVDDDTRARVLDDLREGIAALYALPVEVDTEYLSDGSTSTGSASVDRGSSLLDAELVTPGANGGEITERRIVVDGRFFIKNTDGPAAEVALDFTEITYSPLADEALDEIFTAYGRMGPSLDRWLVLLDAVPFSASISEQGSSIEYRLMLDPLAIVDFYLDSGLEAVGGEVGTAATELTLRFDDGVLVAAEAAGTHFHDGEALDLEATMRYVADRPFVVSIPKSSE